MSARIALPDRLDSTTVGPLAREILAQAGNHLTLESAAVTHCGSLGLQVLMSTKKSWAASGTGLEIDAPAPAVLDALELAGLTLDDITHDEAEA